MLQPDEIVEKVKADRTTCKIVAAAGITIKPEPEAPPTRPGYTWIPYQAKARGPISWVESEYDATMPGTTENPIPYELGLEVYPNYYYVLNDVKKVWTGDQGPAPEWEDDRFAEI